MISVETGLVLRRPKGTDEHYLHSWVDRIRFGDKLET